MTEKPDIARDRVIAVVGPTAAGKSDLAVGLAIELGRWAERPAEIVNADSMQLYRGMDVGTAKLPISERRSVPHHLIDVLEVGESATVAVFQQQAREVIADCHRRAVTPILVGGSALYVRAVLDHFEFPGTDPEVRQGLERELAEVGPEALHARLRDRDPAAAADILPSNGRRLVRALEVMAITSKPFSATLPERTYAYPDVVQIGIDVPRDVLDQRIETRVEAMWQAGFVAEVRALRPALEQGRTACRALGYRQILRFLGGELTEEAAKQETVRATRRFARRQDSWFRKDPRIRWFSYDDPRLLESVLALFVSAESC